MDKSNWSLIFERPKRREERRRGKEIRRGRGREEEEKRREEERKIKKVWNLTFSMDYLDLLYGYMFVGCGL